MILTRTLSSASETQDLAQSLAHRLPPGTLITLNGPLGAGKTTWAQGFGRALGIKRAMSSPTYTIVKEYSLPDQEGLLVHMDAYRLEEGDPSDIDLPYYMTGENYLLIEWAEFIAEVLPDSYLQVTLTPIPDQPDQRKFTLQVIGENSDLEAILQDLDRKE